MACRVIKDAQALLLYNRTRAAGSFILASLSRGSLEATEREVRLPGQGASLIALPSPAVIVLYRGEM